MILAVPNTLTFASWADNFAPPRALEPGVSAYSGPMLNTLTPELKFVAVGSFSIVCVYATEEYGETQPGKFSIPVSPVLLARVHASSLQIPAGMLLPGKNYYWYIESTYAPGSKSEATRTSERMYFSTSKDAK
jgi:hypothetical protein